MRIFSVFEDISAQNVQITWYDINKFNSVLESNSTWIVDRSKDKTFVSSGCKKKKKKKKTHPILTVMYLNGLRKLWSKQFFRGSTILQL